MSPQQLRLRLSHPHNAQSSHRYCKQSPLNENASRHNHGASPTISPSSSFNDLQSHQLLSSQSLHHALHPPLTTIPPRQLFTKSPSKLIPKAKVRFSTLFVLGTIMLTVGSMHRLHFLALHATPTVGSVQGTHREQWGAPHSLQSKRRLGRHPRVIDVSHLPESTHLCSKCSTVWGIFFHVFPFVRLRTRINDPMLHHDGWKPIPRDDAAHIEVHSKKEEDAAEKESQCVPMAEWQTTSFPNCNSVHEIELVLSSGNGSLALPAYELEVHRRNITSHPPILPKQMKRVLRKWPDQKRKKNAKLNAQGILKEEHLEFLGQGWFRSAWKMKVEGVPEYDGYGEEFRFDESVVLKTLRIERDFLEEYYELHRRDALAMERLTFSPYVLDIYGYCGQSAINELANFGIEGMSSLEKVARSFRGMDHIEPVSKIKLQLASMVASGVSHMHSIDYPDFPETEEDSSDDASRHRHSSTLKKVREVTSNATLVHYDLNPRNIAIIKRGKPKLNDFNVAEFMTWDPKKNIPCGFKGRFREPWWRSPEEMHFHLSNYSDNAAPLTEKIDIYSLGNILWDILTTHSPRGKMNKELEAGVRPKVARGEFPKWPSDFNKTKLTTDPALMAIEKAMSKCLRANPEDRPTAGEVADELSEAIDNLPKGFGDKEKWRESMRQGKTEDNND